MNDQLQTVENTAVLYSGAGEEGEPLDGAPAPRPGSAFFPPPPMSLEETALPASLIEQLILKTLYFAGELIGRDIADLLGLHFSVIAPLIELFRRRRLFEVKGSLGFGDVSAVFALSEAGRIRAREYLEENQYVGPAPVPLSEYGLSVRQQRFQTGWLTRQALCSTYSSMVLPPEVLTQLGPALNSGKSLLIYGQPGNGKTYLAHSITSLDSPPVFLPHAVECSGQIIRLFDPIYHLRVDAADSWRSEGYDGRWAHCRRPFIVTGGELTLAMLDLGYNAASKVYDAPLQMKANNGVYLIDDFGRQRATPAEIFNRWIVPMERGVDYLSFQNGLKVEVPFDALLIFSTNLNPASLGDEAFLRRIEYKMLMRNPSPEEFEKIFRQVCDQRRLKCADSLISRFLETHYLKIRKPMRRCHPRDIISHALDILLFEQLPMELTAELLDQAFHGCFVENSEDAAS